jgi:uncharacterized membrane protein YeaQ/YmgE (transglycosylase-associated protein family)
MDILIWLIVGSLLGRVAGWVLETKGVHDIVFNVVVGTSGALLGGWVLTPWLDGAHAHPWAFHSTGVATSIIGAALLIGVLNLMRSDAVH